MLENEGVEGSSDVRLTVDAIFVPIVVTITKADPSEIAGETVKISLISVEVAPLASFVVTLTKAGQSYALTQKRMIKTSNQQLDGRRRD